MVGSRTWTAAAGLGVSIAISVLLWMLFDTLLVFLFVPFVPFLFGSGVWRPGTAPQEPRVCPVCGYTSRAEDHVYCPRDGHRLE